MAEREKGVASAPCPNCGTSLNAVTQPDGGAAYERCDKCYPATVKHEKAAKVTRRETGTDVKEED